MELRLTFETLVSLSRELGWDRRVNVGFLWSDQKPSSGCVAAVEPEEAGVGRQEGISAGGPSSNHQVYRPDRCGLVQSRRLAS